MDPEAEIRDYLDALDVAAAPLDLERRAELVAEIREHIDLALGEAGGRDEATVRDVLSRLGSPEEIVAAEMGGAGSVEDGVSASEQASGSSRRAHGSIWRTRS